VGRSGAEKASAARYLIALCPDFLKASGPEEPLAYLIKLFFCVGIAVLNPGLKEPYIVERAVQAQAHQARFLGPFE
jgi:hypothetical protein